MQFPRVTVAVLASLRSALFALSSLGVLLAVGCAGGPLGNSLEKSLEADPQLQDQRVFGAEAAETETSTPDASEGNTAASATPSPAPPGTEPSIPDVAQALPQPGDPGFIGPLLPNPGESSENPEPKEPNPGDATTLLADVPTDLQPYVQDWLALETQGKATAGNDSTLAGIAFQPNQTITRADYARWLFAANNQFYGDQPAKRIRPGTANGTPAFQDVPTSHPHYGAIQGLAEAGIIPSALTGNSTAVTFRPNDPLTRENLVLWKVPLDIRTALPTATVEAVQATWGFQDAAEIEPLALRAVLADRQTGDFANILRTFGYTTLFQPKKAVSQAEAAATLWRFGSQTEGVSVQDLLKRRESDAAQ